MPLGKFACYMWEGYTSLVLLAARSRGVDEVENAALHGVRLPRCDGVGPGVDISAEAIAGIGVERAAPRPCPAFENTSCAAIPAGARSSSWLDIGLRSDEPVDLLRE